MANPEHVEIVKNGPEAIRRWRIQHPHDSFDLSCADLSGLQLKAESIWQGADGAIDLSQANLYRSILSQSCLDMVNLVDANLDEVQAQYANLKTVNLHGASLQRAELQGANLCGACLDKANLYRAKLNGVNLSNALIRSAYLKEADVSEADLSGSCLHYTYLQTAFLNNANLSDADLWQAGLNEADLSNANIERAKLAMTSLIGAQLISANLRNADISSAIFVGSNLDRADLSNCFCGFAIFADVDLSSTVGLEQVDHWAPSEISVSTLYKSHGKIPQSFLLNCGVPESLIATLSSLIGPTEQYYSCFISYSQADEEFAKKLYARLRQARLRVWYAPESMKWGRKIHEQIESAIRTHDKLLLVLSEASINSEWVKTEIANARQHEVKEGKQVLFPIGLIPFQRIRDWKAFDADTGKDMAREIREYLIPDFSNWNNPDEFEQGIERLLKDLRAAEMQSPKVS